MRFLRKTMCVLLSAVLLTALLPFSVFAETDSLPARYDPLENGKVTPVRQTPQNTGLCWAYATIGAIEQNIIYSGLDNASVDLSESSLAWFSNDSEKMTQKPEQRYSNSYIYAPAFSMARLSGLQYEADEPMFLKTPHQNPVSFSQQGVSEFQLEKMEKVIADRDVIKQKILEYGGAAVCYYNDDGYYSNDHKSYFTKQDQKVNHAVTVVGWDDEYSRDNFGDDKPEKNGAWLVKGVWGTRHDNGYYWISYEEPEISDFYFYKVTRPRSDSVYTHNSGAERMYASSKSVVQAANIFTAEDDEQLDEVSFMVEDNGGEGTEYTVRVYKDVKEDDPSQGEKCAELQGTVQYDGCYFLKLSTPVKLKKGERFSVVLSIKSNNGNNFIVCEDASCTAHSGESFYCTEGKQWKDCMHTPFRNPYINAYTTKTGSVSTQELKKLVDEYSDKKGMQRVIDRSRSVLESKDPSFREVRDACALIEAARNEVDNYIVITTPEEWNQFAASVNDGNQYRDRMVVVEADLDFSSSWFISAGYDDYCCFNGTFDANGHVFSGIDKKEVGTRSKGVFGYLGEFSTVRGLVVKDSHFDDDGSGGIAGTCCGGTITACGYYGKLSGKDCGGIVSELVYGTLSDCWSDVEDVSGIVGKGSSERACVQNCFCTSKDEFIGVKSAQDKDRLAEMLNTNGGDNKSFGHFSNVGGVVRPVETSVETPADSGDNGAKKTGVGVMVVVTMVIAACSTGIVLTVYIIRRKKR